MGKTLLLAEKKEVGIQIISCLTNKDWEKEIKKATGGYYEADNYVTSWAMGHLFIQLKPYEIKNDWGLFRFHPNIDDYKMFDMTEDLLNNHFSFKAPSKDKYKSNQIKVLKSLFARSDIDKIIICTDGDAEGEAIGRDMLSLNRKKVPVFRLWNTGSFKSVDAVNKAFKELKPLNDKKYENLYAQQLARNIMDYIVGMKLTKSLTDTQNRMCEIGRLKGLLISILAKRELDIKTFKPKPYYKVSGLLNSVVFPHYYKNEDNEETSSIFFKDDYESLINICKKNDNTGILIKKENKEITTKERPLPLSGTDFANEIMKRHKISFETANNILSFLREEGLTSYQGTNGRYFSVNDKDEVLLCIDVAKKYFKNEKIIDTLKFDIKNSIFNDKKAEKQNHPPLTVREKIPNDDLFKELETKSKLPFLKESYELILKRVVCNFLEDDLIYKQKLIISIEDKLFRAESSKAINQGWRSFVGMEVKDNCFDDAKLKEGEKITFDDIKTEQLETTIPKLYTVQKFVNMMLNVSKEINILISETEDKEEKKRLEKIKKTLNGVEGIGTERTRPTLISDLKKMEYITIKGKEETISLLEKAWDVYNVMPEDLKTFDMCAYWESSFEKIRNGELFYKDFIKESDQMVIKMIEEIHSKNPIQKKDEQHKTTKVNNKENDSFLPKSTLSTSTTSKKINSDELIVTPKTYRLGDKFIFKNFYFKDLTKTEAMKLLKGEEVEIKRESKGGKAFNLKVKSLGDGKVFEVSK